MPPVDAYFYLDHDQHVTLTPGFELDLARRFWISGGVTYGSGFLRGNGPDHMPRHATADLSLGKEIGEKWSVRLTALNVANALFLTGLANSFAGTHYANPREISAQLRWKFHY